MTAEKVLCRDGVRRVIVHEGSSAIQCMETDTGDLIPIDVLSLNSIEIVKVISRIAQWNKTRNGLIIR